MDSVAFYNSAQQHHNFYPQRQIHDHPYNLSHDEQIAYVSSPAPMSNVHDYCPPPAPKELALPNIGQTRCYWALLDKSLRFLTVDPALAYHLGIGLPNFLEAKLLDFVHPEERESARSDLGSVLEERTLHGSVTRVRYCRLSHIRRLMGVCDEQPPFPPTFPADRVAIDEQYMAVYLVVNCIAEGLVLCFIHAAVDIHSGADNDEHNKSGWTNWCSTHGFDIPEARALYNRLCETVMPTCVVPHNGPDQSLRVFQILKNIPNRPPILSWPPENLVYQQGYVSPSADVLARLSQYVQIGNSLTTTPASDARTSCTRRFKSVQAVDVPTSGGLKTVQVSSIFIPHGMIIFVCHKIEGGFLDSPPTSTSTVSSSSLETPIQQQQPGRNQVQPGHLNLHQLSQIASQEAQVVVNPHDPRAPYARFPYIQQWVNESHDPNAPPVQDLWVKGPFSQHPHAQQQQQQQQWNTYAQPETPSSCSSSNMNNKGDLHWEQALGSYGGGGGGGGNGVLEHSHQEPSSGSSVLYGNGNGGGRPGSSSTNGPDSSTGPGPGQGGGGGGGSGSGGGGGLNGTPFAAAAYHHDQWSAPPQTWDTSGPGYLQSFARDPNASGSAEMYGNSPSDPGHPGALFAAATPTGSVGGGSVTGRVTPGLSGGVENGLQSDVVRVNGVGAGSVSGSTGGGGSRSASKKASRHSLKDGSPGPGTGGKAGRKSKGLGREPYTPAGRAEGKPPPGVANCSSCSTTVSPEWRKGPSGKKELCNACGLRFARSRAKKGAKNASSSPS